MSTVPQERAAAPAPAGPGVEDLRAAWWWAVAQAADRGQEAAAPGDPHRPGAAPGPSPGSAGACGVLTGHDVITVLAATGGSGASTIALALSCAGAAAGAPVRLLDPTPVVRSGLTCAGDRELGGDGTGWLMAQRGHLRIDRRACGGSLPAPRPPVPGEVVVIDQGTQHLGGWQEQVRHDGHLVVVASSTPASLQAARRLADGHHDPVLVVVHHHRDAPRAARHPRAGGRGAGRPQQGWARAVDLRADGLLRRTGLTDAPLPPRVARAGRQVWDAVVELGEAELEKAGPDDVDASPTG